MSKIEVQTIDAPSGQNTVTIGDSNASTITLKSGATLNNFPSNSPSFQAYLGSNSSNLTNGTATKIQYNVESWDIGGCYNNTGSTVTLNGLSATAYSFCPNVAGKYWIYATARVDASSNFPHDAYFAIYKNGSAVNIFQRVAQSTDFTGTLRLGAGIDMNGTGDLVQIYMTFYDGVNAFISNYSSSTLFGAYRLIT
tara:strand:- start:1074 stop:1661 length:588 start_codon:yes stop_codon:yes gene_type:complete